MPALAGTLILILSLLLAAVPATAQDVTRIAAVVNDEIVSLYDLNARMRLTIVSSQLQDSRELRRRLAPQVLRNLVDERLKLQEAKRLGLTVGDGEIDNAIADIAKRNNLRPALMLRQLRNAGVDPRTLRQQIKASLAWIKVVRRIAAPRVRVTEEDVDEALAEAEADKNKPKVRVSEIFLPVDSPTDEREVARLAQRLTQQIKGGADFSALARQFSQASSAAVGGDLGWVEPSRLPAELAREVGDMQPGQLAGPVRTRTGFYIVALLDKRLPGNDNGGAVTLSQLVIPVSGGKDAAAVEAARKQAEEAAAGAGSCDELEAAGKAIGSTMSGRLGTVKLEQLPPPVRSVVQDLAVNTPSKPLPTPAGIAVLMVCDRQEPPKESEAAKRARVRNQLLEQRYDMISRSHLRDLRRNAFLDVRI
jgi:peptidyl-prolyl cis-trans isomerase SurA